MTTDRSQRAVTALTSADPEFVELCKMLYGEAVDADVVWADVFGSEPFVKTAAPKVGDQARGILTSTTELVNGFLRPTGRHAAPAETSAFQLGQALHRPLEHKVATGAMIGAGAAGNQRGKAKGRRQGYLRAKAQDAYYAKGTPDVEWSGTFSKFDDEKHQAFGFASVVKKNGMPVIDRQGDFVTPDDMETAAYLYVQKSRKGGDMHRRTVDDQPYHVSDLIESVVFTPEKCQAMGMPDQVAKNLEGHWWVGYQIHDEDVWAEVKKRGRTGFSIHGRGKRTPTTVDAVMEA